MSLRRRLTGAAALAVAAVSVTLGITGYVSTRSHLIGEVQQELRGRAAPFLQPHSARGRGPSGAENGGGGDTEPSVPSPPPVGGAPGYFQFVRPDGTVRAGGGGNPQLPVDPSVLNIAKQARGGFFTTAKVNGTHVEVLTVGDPYDRDAVQVALPLTATDNVLDRLAVTFGLLGGAGILLAVVLGALIARSALAPIERFSEETETVTGALDRPRRLEETGAPELRRLAGTFNRTLDALERSIAAQRHLIADASHELRTPMAALRSNIQVFLEADRLPPGERDELQHAIIAELDDLTQLVSDVVELARGSAPSAQAEPVEVDVIVREAVARTLRRGPGLQIDSQLEPTVISGSPERVARAVTNVIDNARKWSPADGRIEVTLAGGTLAVRDHGPGFTDDDLPHVFDRFYRADAARRMPGSGLGLAIVKQAAEAHGGFAEALNAPDGGAVLRVSFGPLLQTS